MKRNAPNCQRPECGREMTLVRDNSLKQPSSGTSTYWRDVCSWKLLQDRFQLGGETGQHAFDNLLLHMSEWFPIL